MQPITEFFSLKIDMKFGTVVYSIHQNETVPNYTKYFPDVYIISIESSQFFETALLCLKHAKHINASLVYILTGECEFVIEPSDIKDVQAFKNSYDILSLNNFSDNDCFMLTAVAVNSFDKHNYNFSSWKHILDVCRNDVKVGRLTGDLLISNKDIEVSNKDIEVKEVQKVIEVAVVEEPSKDVSKNISNEQSVQTINESQSVSFNDYYSTGAGSILKINNKNTTLDKTQISKTTENNKIVQEIEENTSFINDNSKDIAFIIPNRGGKNIEYIINKFKKFYPNAEYIVVTLDDDKLFCRGLLFNIGYMKTDRKYLVLCDNDIFFPEYIDLIGKYNELNCAVLQPFSIINQVTITEDCSYKITSSERLNYDEYKKLKNYSKTNGFACGGITFISRENYQKINGFSNMYIGWGGEDNDFFLRVNKNYKKLETKVNHITHPSRQKNKNKSNNYKFLNSFKSRNIQDDGVLQMTYNLKSDKITDEIRYIYVDNISVIDSFKYLNDYKKIL